MAKNLESEIREEKIKNPNKGKDYNTNLKKLGYVALATGIILGGAYAGYRAYDKYIGSKQMSESIGKNMFWIPSKEEKKHD